MEHCQEGEERVWPELRECGVVEVQRMEVWEVWRLQQGEVKSCVDFGHRQALGCPHY